MVRSPRSDGLVERMNRTLLDEYLRIKGREKWYISVEEVQLDPCVVLGFDSTERSRQGQRDCRGRRRHRRRHKGPA